MKDDRNLVCLLHGREGSPTSTKMQLLTRVAVSCGFEAVVMDHRHLLSPDERVQHVLQESLRPSRRLVLVGSSMGGYVATVASLQLQPDGLFLLAPALFQDGYDVQNPAPQARWTAVVHGWQDEQIPVDGSIRFAREYRADLHLFDSDHRLKSHLDEIELLLRHMLVRIAGSE